MTILKYQFGSSKKAIGDVYGFTVIELLVASTVFSIVLLVSLVGFLQIGKIFYKGVTVSQASQSAKSINEGLKADIVYAASLPNLITPHPAARTVTVNGSSYTVRYFCAGNARYTYIQGLKVDTSNHNIPASRFGLLRDTLNVPGCPNPYSGAPGSGFNNPTELLGDKMRLSTIQVTRPSAANPNLYNLDVRVTYGDDQVLQAASSPNPTCISGINYSAYCYVYTLQTSVAKGY